MATSGTIGLTRIDTTKLLEKATRRCGLPPQILTPELVDTAMESLFMLLLSLSNRGLNLWCIDNQLMPLKSGQGTYTLPVGTQDVLNLLLCSPSRADSRISRYGVKFSTLPTVSFTLQGSDDGVTWLDLETRNAPTGTQTYHWFNLDVLSNWSLYQISSNGVVEDLFLAGDVREIPITPLNRDDYSSLPNKSSQSDTPTNYYFEKLLDPRITLWPVPSDDTTHLSLYRYRQIEDVGSMTQEIEIPSRWYEAISWHLASRLAFEFPGVDPARRAEVVQMANGMTIEVEQGETDNAPVYFAPSIGVYTA